MPRLFFCLLISAVSFGAFEATFRSRSARYQAHIPAAGPIEETLESGEFLEEGHVYLSSDGLPSNRVSASFAWKSRAGCEPFEVGVFPRVHFLCYQNLEKAGPIIGIHEGGDIYAPEHMSQLVLDSPSLLKTTKRTFFVTLHGAAPFFIDTDKINPGFRDEEISLGSLQEYSLALPGIQKGTLENPTLVFFKVGRWMIPLQLIKIVSSGPTDKNPVAFVVSNADWQNKPRQMKVYKLSLLELRFAVRYRAKKLMDAFGNQPLPEFMQDFYYTTAERGSANARVEGSFESILYSCAHATVK